jgi:nucleoside recognition membrane protein YjiH
VAADMAIKQSHNLTTILTFLVPSVLGLLLFLTPIEYQGAITIPFALLARTLQDLLGESITAIVTGIVLLTALVTLFNQFFKIRLIKENHFLNNLFAVSPVWFVIRLIAAVFIVLTFFNIGPEILSGTLTGSVMLNELLPVLLCVFICAGMLLPLLLNFGLLELLGTLLTKVMRPLFNLPGRSAVDCMASWFGDSSVGILMTSREYEARYYTQREAAVIGTTFSAVSITFSLVVISQVGLAHLFIPFYLTVCLAGVVAAIIVPKLPPLCWKADRYIDGTEQTADIELIPEGYHFGLWALELALQKAANAPGFKVTVIDGLKNAAQMLFAVLPVVMAVGTMALIIAHYTPVFEYLGYPFIPFLELLHIPEASAASKTMIIGFTDIFIPAILASSIQSELTRFIIAAMSVTQLIYMSEVGALLLSSKIPVNMIELFVIFILRTLVTLPLIAGITHLIF